MKLASKPQKCNGCTMHPAILKFEKESRRQTKAMAVDRSFGKLSAQWFLKACQHQYHYHFKWLDRPIIQFPQDILAVQELIWNIKPDLIIETGVAHGGSLMLSASILSLIGNRGLVAGIDVDIRSHNRREIEKHPLAKFIRLIQGGSTDPETFDAVCKLAKGRKKILVILDSNHTHEHVLQELKLYSNLVQKGSYLIVFDTVIEWMPKSYFKDRPWKPGRNPMTAIREFLKTNHRFRIDDEIDAKLQISSAPNGYLQCVK